MIKNGFQTNVKINYSDADMNLTLKPYSLLNFLQDIAGKNADDLGFGYSYIHPRNLIWVILKYRIEFEEYPEGTGDLTILTEPRGFNKLFAYRDFELYRESRCMCRVFSSWALVNTENKTMTPIQSAIPNHPRMQHFVKREDDLSFSKIKQVTNSFASEKFKVRYNDIDLNGHANNGNYIVWALEPLNYEFRLHNRIKTLDIFYKKEAKYGEIIEVLVENKDSNTTVHEIKNQDGESLCQIECTWIES